MRLAIILDHPTLDPILYTPTQVADYAGLPAAERKSLWHYDTGTFTLVSSPGINFCRSMGSWTQPFWRVSIGGGNYRNALLTTRFKSASIPTSLVGFAGSGANAFDIYFSSNDTPTESPLNVFTDSSTTNDKVFSPNGSLGGTKLNMVWAFFNSMAVTQRIAYYRSVALSNMALLHTNFAQSSGFDPFFDNGATSPTTTGETDIIAVQFIEPANGLAFVTFERDTTSIAQSKLVTKSASSLKTSFFIDKSAVPRMHGVFCWNSQVAASDGLYHNLFIYGEGTTLGRLMMVHFTTTSLLPSGATYTLVGVPDELFPGLTYDTTAGGSISGGPVSIFLDKDAEILHVWFKEGTAIDNSVHYKQININATAFEAAGLEFPISDDNVVVTLAGDYRTWAIHGGAQDGKICLVLTRTTTQTITVYQKHANDDWRVVEEVSNPNIPAFGIAYLQSDYDTPTGDVFVQTVLNDGFIGPEEVLMNAARHDIVVERYASFSTKFAWWDEDSQPVNLTSYAAKLSLRENAGTDVLLTISSGNGISFDVGTGEITTVFTTAQTSSLSINRGFYDMLLYPFLSGAAYLLEAGIEFTSANIDADNGNSRAVITFTGVSGYSAADFPSGGTVYLYGAENAANNGVYTIFSSDATSITLTTPLSVDNTTDSTLNIQGLDTNALIRLVEGTVYVHPQITEP